MSEVQAAPARRRWRPRITVRMLMILVLLCGGIGPYANGIRVQKAAVRAIEEAGGHVIYDWEWKPNADWKPGTEWEQRTELAGWRRRVADRLGPDAVASVAAVVLRNPRANDAVMAHVGRLWSLRELQLFETSITDSGMAPLSQLTKLQIFYLVGDMRGGPLHRRRVFKFLGGHRGLKNVVVMEGTVTDEDLIHLAGLTELEFLTIIGAKSPITDAGLVHLSKLTRMKRLMLDRTEVTAAGLEQLKGMTDLEHLGINSSKVTDLGVVAHFPKLEVLDASGFAVGDGDLAPLLRKPGLRTISLSNTQITDAGLALLRDLPNLERLSFCGTAVTDAGMRGLIDFPKLKNLMITGSKVTKAGIADFRKVRPFVPIYN